MRSHKTSKEHNVNGVNVQKRLSFMNTTDDKQRKTTLAICAMFREIFRGLNAKLYKKIMLTFMD